MPAKPTSQTHALPSVAVPCSPQLSVQSVPAKLSRQTHALPSALAVPWSPQLSSQIVPMKLSRHEPHAPPSQLPCSAQVAAEPALVAALLTLKQYGERWRVCVDTVCGHLKQWASARLRRDCGGGNGAPGVCSVVCMLAAADCGVLVGCAFIVP